MKKDEGCGPVYAMDEEKWRFSCRVDWKTLVEARAKFPDDAELEYHVNQMTAYCGEDYQRWPIGDGIAREKREKRSTSFFF